MGRAVPCTICQLVSTNNYLGLCFLVYLSSQFLQFLCKILHNLSAYIVPICQLVSSKSLNFVFRTTSLVNAPFREMFCKHFETHINRGERQKLKEMVISKSNLDIQEIFNPKTVFWCDVSRSKGVLQRCDFVFWDSYHHTLISLTNHLSWGSLSKQTVHGQFFFSSHHSESICGTPCQNGLHCLPRSWQQKLICNVFKHSSQSW